MKEFTSRRLMLSDAGLAYGMGVMDESMNRMHEFSMNDERMARVLSVRRPIKQASPLHRLSC